MARRPRLESIKNIYHVVIKGINQQVIFVEEYDYIKFKEILIECKEKYKFKLFAYCILNNHIHLLISPNKHKIGQVVKSFSISFVSWYNNKYQRSGHLFQGRFGSTPVDTEDYFLTVVNYILCNPIKAKMVKDPADYKWCSMNAYIKNDDELVDVKQVLSAFGSLEKLKKSVHEYSLKKHYYIDEDSRRMIDNEALAVIFEETGCKTPDDFSKLPREDKKKHFGLFYKEYKMSKRQLARLTGVSRTTIDRMLRER